MLLSKAKATLKANIIETAEGPLSVAGAHQFKTIWIRDFCLSVQGLLNFGQRDLVERQLQLIYRYKNKDHSLPRGLDTINPKLRVVCNTLSRKNWRFLEYQNHPLKAEYLGEHGTWPVDSNLLFLRAYHQAGLSFLKPSEIEELFSVYKRTEQGVLAQAEYSDWQDSAKRKGPVLYTNLLYLETLQRFGRTTEAELLEKNVRSLFKIRKNETWNEFPDKQTLALDSHTFLINSPYILSQEEKKSLFEKLRQHKIWTQDLLPGRPVSENYKPGEISWTTKLVGLRHYHDSMIWGWLVAECVQACTRMGEQREANRIKEAFAKAHRDFNYLGEIYQKTPSGLNLFKGRLYQSEIPFTWTAAKWLEV
jgi:glycogen debranching enzyme